MPIVSGTTAVHDVVATQRGRGRSCWSVEDDADAIVRNCGEREPDSGEQSFRAGVRQALKLGAHAECVGLGVPVVAARPFDTLPERVLAALA